ncbi:hypothetical protein Q3G72_008936 [Acer saccharum]|nr:hypothetical protein Q3G72_008936 [Acer saccharum]
MQKPYQDVVVEGKWGSLEEFLDHDEGFSMAYPMMTVAKDTLFHFAVHSRSAQPLEDLLERVSNNEHIRDNILNTTNAYENTVLHEAAINYNIAAVKLLVEGDYVTPQHLLDRNKSGQTPCSKLLLLGAPKWSSTWLLDPIKRPVLLVIRNSKMLTALIMIGSPFSMLLYEGSTLVDQNNGEVGDNQNPPPLKISKG